MPYCCQCGSPAGDVDRYCAKCGAPQPGHAQPNPGQHPGQQRYQPPRADGAPNPYPPYASTGISPKHASLLCYIPWFGWIACVLVLATDRFKRDRVEGPEVRFHAFQGLFLFVAWLIVDWIISPMLRVTRDIPVHFVPQPVGGILQLLILAAWIMMIVKVSQNEHYRLPIIGEMAERSVNEHR